MVPPKYTIFQCIAKVFGIVGKYPFSIFLLLLVLYTIVTVAINKKIKTKAPIVIAVLSWITVAIFMIFKYWQAVTFFRKTLKSETYTAIYFPNMIIYILMIIFTIIIIARSIIKKEDSVSVKIMNAIGGGVIGVNLILILRETFKENITIYEATTIFKYQNLQVLIQTSTIIFVLWIIALLVNFISKKAAEKLDKMPAPTKS